MDREQKPIVMNMTTNFRLKLTRPDRGFTLVELLVTISILAILTAVTVPSLAGLSKSGKFDSAISGLSETLSLARQTAVAHNTYVWVAFAIPSTQADPPLATLVVSSTDGTNPFSTNWSSSITLPDPRFLVVANRANYSQCRFVDSGVLTQQQIPMLPLPLGDTINSLSSNLSFKFNTSTGPETFTRVLEYTPTGQVYNGPNPVSFVEFGIQPGPSTSATTSSNVACFRVAYITGRTQLYRP